MERGGLHIPPCMFFHPRRTLGKMGVPHLRKLDAKGPEEGGNLKDPVNHVVSVREGA